MRTIDPDVTGTPVQLYEYTTLLKSSYEMAACYSLIAIAILVFIHFRSVSAVILSLLPVAIGTLWLIGLMGWLKIPFNPANIMTLPLVIGIGVTNGIHILNRFAEERTPGIFIAQHRQSRARVRIDGHRRIRQSDFSQSSWHL
ncbi:MAG: MMPL family transporter [Limisphaerales bacterium]